MDENQKNRPVASSNFESWLRKVPSDFFSYWLFGQDKDIFEFLKTVKIRLFGRFGWEKVAKNWLNAAILLRYGRFPEIGKHSEKLEVDLKRLSHFWPILTYIIIFYWKVPFIWINVYGSFVKIRYKTKMRWLFKRKCSEKLDVNKLWTIDVKTLVNWWRSENLDFKIWGKCAM